MFLSRLCAAGVIFAMAISCKPVSVQTVTDKPTAETADPVEGMVFLSFVMRDSASGKSVELTGKTIVHQRLKADPPHTAAANRIWINQLTESGAKLSAVALDHPLFKRVEFANDQGTFESKEITLREAEFFARVTLFTQTEYIRVEEELWGVITYAVTFKLRD